MSQQKSFHEWHIIPRCLFPLNVDVWQERAIRDAVHTFLVEMQSDDNVIKILAGEEVGKKENKLHWHITIILHRTWSDATLRSRCKQFKEHLIPFSVQKRKKELLQLLRYTVKTSIFFNYGFTPEEAEGYHTSWVPDKDFIKKSSKSIVQTLHELAIEAKVDTKDSYAVTLFVCKYYQQKYKGFNDFQVTSVVKGIVNQNDDKLEEYAHNLWSKNIAY